MREGVPLCGRVFPSVRGCVPMKEGVSQCGRVCPSEGGCSPMWEGVPQCGRVWVVVINMYSTMVFLEKILCYDY